MELRREIAPVICREAECLLSRVFGDGSAPQSPELRGAEADVNLDIFYTAWEGETLLGTVRATIPKAAPTLCGISNMCTAPEARGLGLGKRLFKAITDEVFSMGVQAAYLGTSNPLAAKMYHSCGFSFLPGSNVMVRYAAGDTVDFTRTWFSRMPDCYTVVSGSPAMRIPTIPLALHRGSQQILDCNAGLISSAYMTQLACMGIYPRYESVQARGGQFYGAANSSGILGATATVMPTKRGLRADFTCPDSWQEAAARLLTHCERKHGQLYLHLADEDLSKQELVKQLGYVRGEASLLSCGSLQLPGHIYGKTNENGGK